MTTERWQEIKAILDDALACHSDADRLRFVAASCGDDASLKTEIGALLAAHDSTWCDENFLAGLKRLFVKMLEPPAPPPVTQ